MGSLFSKCNREVHVHKIIQDKNLLKKKWLQLLLLIGISAVWPSQFVCFWNIPEQNIKILRYKCGPAPGFDLSEWTSVKPNLGLDFPNLPYLIDGNIKITQSNAVLRYLGRKFGLDGKTEVDKVRVDMMCDNAMDFRNGFVGLSYNPQFEELKAGYVKNLEATLKKFSDFLGDRQFFSADYLTYPDFHMYEMLYSHLQLAPGELIKFPNLIGFLNRMEALPKIGDFLKSPKGQLPMNNKMAKFGAKL